MSEHQGTDDDLPVDEFDAGVVDNPWRRLRGYTDARIGLGRSGISLPTRELLAFQLAHAQAQDAVHFPLDMQRLRIALTSKAPGLAPGMLLQSQAQDRAQYLQRPDLGRRLAQSSLAMLQDSAPVGPFDLAPVIVDGLSSRAVQDHAAGFLAALLAELDSDRQAWRLAPPCLVEQGRVAIGDDIGQALGASAALVLIGERPGLSSPDSLGLYLTWNPRRGLTDAARNCISNIRPAGLAYAEAARRALYLLQEARRLGLSGVSLKDRSESRVIEQAESTMTFLTR